MSNIIGDPKHLQRVRKLYKIVLKLHRGLPHDVKTLGDLYAREEFRRHKNCTMQEAAIFMNEWTGYALTLGKQLGLKGPKYSNPLGVDLKEEEIDKMREDQIQQLYDLMVATTGNDEESGNSKNNTGS